MTFLKRLLAALALVSLATPAAAQISGYSTTAASNTSVGGVSIAEGMAPGNVNDGMRAIMADLASFYSGAGTKFTGNVTLGDAASDTVQIAGVAGIGTTPSATVSLTARGSATASIFNLSTSTASTGYGTFTNSSASVRGYIGFGGGGAISGLTVNDFVLRGESSLVFALGDAVAGNFDAAKNLVVGTASAPASTAGAIVISNGTPPSANPVGGGVLFVEGGALKYRGSSGTVTTIAAP